MKFFLSIFLLSISFQTLSQTYSVSGTVVDEKSMPISSVVIDVTDKDAVKYHGFTNKEGAFLITGILPGFYHVRFSFIGKGIYEDSLWISNSNINMKPATLFPVEHMLNEVRIVEKLPAMVQKGDTIEFNSGAYKVNPDADVADLIRKMPFVSISRNNVTVQGENVTNVLLDGKPFFGNDPYITLKTLPAEIVAKIQVYTGKTDQEQLTGFSEGNTTKTINIVTKEDRHTGVFGSIYGGYGTDNSGEREYGTGGAINEFNGDQRVTITGQSNNINAQNFTSEDIGSSGDEGKTKTNAAGINYSDTWGKKTDISGSYFYNETNTNVIGQIRQTYILPADLGQVYNQSSISSNQSYDHHFNLRICYTADTLNTIVWQPSFSYNKNYVNNIQQGGTQEAAATVNQTTNNNAANIAGYNFASSLLFEHKFSKKHRTFSVNITTNNNSSNGTNKLTAQNIYYNSLSLNDTINQQSHQNQNGWNLAGNAAYTEPIGTHGMLKLEYNLTYQPALSEMSTYDYSYITDKYTLPDSIYSNSFYSKNLTNKTGVSYLFTTGKYEFLIGLNYQFTELTNDQAQPVNNSFNRGFGKFLPLATLRYKLSQTKSLQLIYNTNAQVPSVNQMQNIVNITDPLHLYTGNPYLQQTFRHSLVLRYNSINNKTSNVFSASLTGNYTINGVTSSSIVAGNDTFVTNEHILLPKNSQLTIPININGNSSVKANIGFGVPLNTIKCNLNLNLDAAYSYVPAIINNEQNDEQNKNAGAGISITSNISEDIDFMISSNTNIVSNANSLNTEMTTTYVNQNVLASVNMIFWKGFVFNSNVSYQANSGLSAGFNYSYTLWNMSVGKRIFKKEQGDIRLSVNDILNDNNNIQHIITDTYIQDSRSNVLQRYFLIIFTYKISNFKSSE